MENRMILADDERSDGERWNVLVPQYEELRQVYV
jgi:hypothetical protein